MVWGVSKGYLVKWLRNSNTGLGLLEGNPNAGIHHDNNSIQFVGGAFAQAHRGGTFYSGSRGGAFTLGNVEIYGGDVTPTTPDDGYSHNLSIVQTQDHEVQHTYQYQDLGLAFLPDYLKYGVQSPNNPFEQAADRGARGGSPYPYDLMPKGN